MRNFFFFFLTFGCFSIATFRFFFISRANRNTASDSMLLCRTTGGFIQDTTPLGCLFIAVSVQRRRPLAAHSGQVGLPLSQKRPFPPRSGACRRSAPPSEGEFSDRLQWRMNEPIDLSLCGETAHEYRALTGATGRMRSEGRGWEIARGGGVRRGGGGAE